MEYSENKPMFFKALMLLAILLLADAAFLAYKYESNFTGLAVTDISDGVSKTYQSISIGSRMLLIGQWILIFFTLAFIFMRDKKLAKWQNDVKEIHLTKASGRSSTDLDILYSLLKDKKRLRLSEISRVFKVTKEVAMEWCKILESGNLGSIDYPGVGEPVLTLK